MFSSPLISERVRPLAAGAITAAIFCFSGSAEAAGKRGDFIQTDALGINLVTHDLDQHTTRTVRDAVNLSQYIGLHGYVVDRLRLGATLQLTERLWPEPAPGARIQRFAVLPQIGWNFYDPFFTALAFVVAPRSEGKAQLNLSLQLALGVSLPISKRVRFSLSAALPWTFYDRNLIGVSAQTGIVIRL
ncbi:MAG TPA: hypothetical protein VJV79_36220 [Polyangiaceae bacterium]|nr:hypothetical protein [Polyangiaceae bacterium]